CGEGKGSGGEGRARHEGERGGGRPPPTCARRAAARRPKPPGPAARPPGRRTPPRSRPRSCLPRLYLSLPPPPTIFFARHLSKIWRARVLASIIESFGDMAPVAALANMSVITYVSKSSPSAGVA